MQRPTQYAGDMERADVPPLKRGQKEFAALISYLVASVTARQQGADADDGDEQMFVAYTVEYILEHMQAAKTQLAQDGVLESRPPTAVDELQCSALLAEQLQENLNKIRNLRAEIRDEFFATFAEIHAATQQSTADTIDSVASKVEQLAALPVSAFEKLLSQHKNEVRVPT